MEPTLSLDITPDTGMGTLKYLTKQAQLMRRGTTGATRAGRSGRGDRNSNRLDNDPQSQQRQKAMEARIEQLENLLQDTSVTVMDIKTAVNLIDVLGHTAAEKATENETHTKALDEEVGAHAAKLNEYENGKLSKATTTAVNKVVDKQLTHGISLGTCIPKKSTASAHRLRYGYP